MAEEEASASLLEDALNECSVIEDCIIDGQGCILHEEVGGLNMLKCATWEETNCDNADDSGVALISSGT